MNIVFINDHKLKKIDNKIFSVGGLGGDGFYKKYVKNISDKLYLYTRVEEITEKKDSKLLEVENDQVIAIPSNEYKQVSDSVKKSKKIKEEVRKVLTGKDLCIIRVPSVLGNIAYKEAKRVGIPVFVEVVGCPRDALYNYGNLKGKLLAPYMYIKTKEIVKNAKNVHYVSKKFLQERYPTKGAQLACSDVVIKELDEEILNKRIDKIKSNRNKYIFGLIGSLDVNYKGHETVIKAFGELKGSLNFEIQFLGAGNQERWKTLARKCNIEEEVKFIGTLPSGEPVMDWLDSIDMHLIISKQEGFPRSLVEAMSRANVSLGSNIGGIPELLEEEFMVGPNDYRLLAKKILENIKNSEKMIEVATKNFNKIKEYEYENLNKKRMEFYEAALKEYKLLK